MGDFQPGDRGWLLYPANGRMIRPEMVKPVWMVKLSGKYKRPKRSYITKWNMYKEAEHMDKRADLPYNFSIIVPEYDSGGFRMLQVPKGFIEKPV